MSSTAESTEPEPGPVPSLAEAAGWEIQPPTHDLDLKNLLETYERSLILAALGAVGGRQRSAAEILRILPTTLNEKMRRLGIRPQRSPVARASSANDVCATLRWRGPVPPGGTVEVRGLNGPVRVEAGHDDQVEVSAVRKGSREVLQAIEIKIVEHARGLTVCAVCQGLVAAVPRSLDRSLARGVAGVRVELLVRVPPGVHVRAGTVNDDIEIVGLVSNVEAGTANGRVRFLPALPSAPSGGWQGGGAPGQLHESDRTTRARAPVRAGQLPGARTHA